jgi:hypothetical protein
MKIILHIGCEKTASTTLQQTLHSNRKHLIDNKIYFSCVNNSQNHIFIVDYIHFDKMDNVKRSYLKELLINDFQIAKNLKCNAFIISSELISSYVNTIDKITDLHLLLSELFESLEVICYLRPQVDLHISRINTMIKGGVYISESNFWKDLNSNNYYYNYAEQYKIWSSIFGEHNINFRPYLNLDIVDDFFKFLKLDYSNFTKVNSLNKSFDVNLLAILNSVNHARNSAYIEHMPFFDEINVHKKLIVNSSELKRMEDLFHECNAELLEMNIDFPKNGLNSNCFHSIDIENH